MFREQVQSDMLNVETALFERIATFIEILNILYPCIISHVFVFLFVRG